MEEFSSLNINQENENKINFYRFDNCLINIIIIRIIILIKIMRREEKRRKKKRSYYFLTWMAPRKILPFLQNGFFAEKTISKMTIIIREKKN